MKTVSLSGSPRENVGKKDAKQLRNNGQVPCVLYGGDDQIHLSVAEADLRKLVYTPEVYKIELDVNGDKRNVIIKDMQFHPVTDDALHIDFLQLFEDKEVNVKLPVRISGSSPGVLAGGKIAQHFRRLTVRGLPKDMQECVDVNIGDLNIGDAVRVSDIDMKGLRMMDAASAVIIAVKMARGAATSEEETEEGADTEESGEAAAE